MRRAVASLCLLRFTASCRSLAHRYRCLKNYAEAEKRYQGAIELFTVLLGQRHPETLLVTAHSALNMKDSGRPGEAVVLLLEVLRAQEAREDAKEPKAVDTISTAAWIAGCLLDQVCVDEANNLLCTANGWPRSCWWIWAADAYQG